MVIADDEVITRMQLEPPYEYIIDPRAVGRLKILEYPASVAEAQPRMVAGNIRARQNHLAARVATDEQFVPATTPVQCKQKRWLTTIALSPVAAYSRDERSSNH